MKKLINQSYFLGWTIDQWALAVERVGLDGTTIKHANRCRSEYIRRYGCDPGGVEIIGVNPPANYDLAYALFENVNGIYLEPLEEDEMLDISYEDHTKDDMEYEEAFKNRYRH